MNVKESEDPRLQWFKGSYSGDEGGDCVEVAPAPSVMHVQDSKVIQKWGIAVPPTPWLAFLDPARRI
ncbi:DUF397 domain-containing protein [Streptomyces sp. NPDC020802]|uniref:DUF397 domain-containing protein n=1 Tax=Streptomyces sp. NPDC020802 TaxID=3365094 RepID=UPI0037B37ECC